MRITDAEKEFIIGLEELTRKTGIVISGCGCCGSPFLSEQDITTNQEESGYGWGDSDIQWMAFDDKYVEKSWEDRAKRLYKNNF